MKYLLLFIMVSASACGAGPFIEPGDYDVSSFFVRDDFLGQAGKESATIWVVEEDGGEYTITVMGGTKNAAGSVEDEHLTIYKEDTLGCGGKTTYSATIAPREDSNDQFTGVANLTIDMCSLDNVETLFVEAHLVGVKQ